MVRFTSPFSRISGQERVRMEADTLGDLCRQLVKRYGPEMDVLLDSEGKISRGIVVLVNRMNAYALSGADTALKEDSEVLIMPILSGG